MLGRALGTKRAKQQDWAEGEVQPWRWGNSGLSRSHGKLEVRGQTLYSRADQSSQGKGIALGGATEAHSPMRKLTMSHE